MSVKDLPNLWLSIDPGDVHVGVALWQGPTCIAAQEMTPHQTEDAVFRLAQDGKLGLLIVERFALDGWRAQPQAGSKMLTSQLIGSLTFIARQFEVPLVLQDRRARTSFKRERRVWKGRGDHAHDAEAHGLAYVAYHQAMDSGLMANEGLPVWPRPLRARQSP